MVVLQMTRVIIKSFSLKIRMKPWDDKDVNRRKNSFEIEGNRGLDKGD